MNRFFCLLILIAFPLFPFELETDIEGETSEEMIELLESLLENPVDVNTATKKNLLSIPFITEEIADGIIRARETRGGFTDKDSFRKLIPLIIYERIEPFVVVIPPKVVSRRPSIYPEVRVRTRVENRYPRDDRAPGNALGLYNRILIDYGQFSGCVLQEKDEGERDFVDFLAFGVKAKNVGHLEDVVVGYYGLDFGERLVLASPVLTFKGSPYQMRRKGIHLYTITGENTYKRGIALKTEKFGLFDISLFYSNASLDARGSDSVYYTYSADHITSAWEDIKDRVKEVIYGGHIDISGGYGTIGATYYHASDYDSSEKRSYSPASVNFSIPGGRVTFFGEVAYSRDFAAVCGVKSRGDKFMGDVVLRYLPRSFFSPHSSPFSDRRISSYGLLNDKGIYTCLLFKPFPKTELTIYGDHMEWEDDELPGRGYEYRIILDRRITKGFELGVSYRYKCKDDDYARFARVEMDVSAIKWIGLRLRTEWAEENDTLSGELVFGDVYIHPLNTLSINYRHIIFDSDLTRFKFTEYERELPGVMGNKFITGHGRRNYLLVSYKPFKFLRFSVKYEETFKKSSKLSGQVDLNLTKIKN
ncbi:MAG: hypothetical protein COT45_01325 [bacterium (Candidatus Stahlbacteria) CG08_land_8_20_14_0_20_40_26]|nr:MAG: hypothetical protein COT45_01325 [bacterium (Candidatus Stahlbacteria) CG08_land_8_20_14_0_20_40_26]